MRLRLPPREGWVRRPVANFRWWFLRWATTPEPKRLDHDRTYLWLHLGLVLVGLGIAARPYRSSVAAALSADTNAALALCMVIGSSICLGGALLGLGRIAPSAQTDLRIPYVIGMSGQLSVVMSLLIWVYEIQRTSDLVGTLSGGLAIAILAACVHFDVVAIKEVARLTREARKVRGR